ncbi:hypothetical protein LZG54_10390 [Acinetobacter towneri]|nr:hypothetical protein LZG54_10390 [Acinetobacter towneri]
MDIENFIAEFKKTFVYDVLKDYVTDEKLFDHFVTENGDIVFLKEQTRQMWSMWQAAKAIPDGFVLNKPAKVGSGTFGIGVKWSIVIGAAQRQFEYTQNDVGEKANIQNLKGILFDVPKGFVLVPKEPTQKMLNAGHVVMNPIKGSLVQAGTNQKRRDCYKAMIEAAQEQANESE